MTVFSSAGSMHFGVVVQVADARILLAVNQFL
jgi:hypothetical protein